MEVAFIVGEFRDTVGAEKADHGGEQAQGTDHFKKGSLENNDVYRLKNDAHRR